MFRSAAIVILLLVCGDAVSEERAPSVPHAKHLPAAHALGTARAFQLSETAGAFASLGMILNAILSIGLVPILMAAL